jgi:hypothetical protein
MSNLCMMAIPMRVADLVRTTMKSPGYGHPAHREIAGGYGPCRFCLRTFRVGHEERLLFTYDPFHGLAPFPLPGSIFIHAEGCKRYELHNTFPEDLRAHALTLIGYGDNRTGLMKEYVEGSRAEEVAKRLLEDPAIHYLHVRDTKAGCYDFRIERG